MKHSPGFLKLVGSVKKLVRQINIAKVMAKLRARRPFYFIDVREDHEWAKGHCPGAMHVGRGILERDIEALIPDRKAEIVLYCGGGFRSALAAESLGKMGYKNVLSMAGGFRGWVSRRGRVVKP